MWSRKDTVDPDDIIARYGADTARWFMLSDSPPERDVIWTEEGARGPARFVQRVYRIVGTWRTGGRRAAARATTGRGAASARPPIGRCRRRGGVERLRFNRCVAHIYELANALKSLVRQRAGPGRGGLAEAAGSWSRFSRR